MTHYFLIDKETFDHIYQSRLSGIVFHKPYSHGVVLLKLHGNRYKDYVSKFARLINSEQC